jgi:hypothetical protein
MTRPLSGTAERTEDRGMVAAKAQVIFTRSESRPTSTKHRWGTTPSSTTARLAPVNRMGNRSKPSSLARTRCDDYD